MQSSHRVLTNMTFWQSELWLKNATSIYDLGARRDPVPRPWWREALALWWRAGRYEVVLTEGVRTSMAFALLSLLTLRRPRQIMTEVFIDEAQPDNLRWCLKTWWHALLARRALGIITNSSTELTTMAARYGLDPARLRYVPLNTNITEPQLSPQDEGFVFSAGRTLRDYTSLVMAARHIAAPVIIICGHHDLDRVTLPLPANITVMHEVPREVYLDHLRRCRVVALPLMPTERSTGQVVMLEAMSMGKPVVTTRSPGTIDYIRDGETGFLVEVEDAAELTHRVNLLLRDRSLARQIGEAAVADMRERGSADRHARLKLEAIQELRTRS